MKKLNLTITAGELPPGPEYINGLRDELKKTKHSVSGLCTAAIGLALVGFVGLQWAPATAALGETVAGLAFAGGLIGFMFGNLFDQSLAQQVAEVSPVPENLLAEAAALGNASPVAREYVAGLRAQKREMTLAELGALRKLLASTPAAVAREALYG